MEIRIIDNKKNTHPNILYKYRNWDNELHKKVLTDNIFMIAIFLKNFPKNPNYMIFS